MPKRTSDIQITKDYPEHDDDDAVANGNPTSQGRFEKADEDVLKRRRIISARKPVGTSAFGSGGGGIFSGVSLMGGNDTKKSTFPSFAQPSEKSVVTSFTMELTPEDVQEKIRLAKAYKKWVMASAPSEDFFIGNQRFLIKFKSIGTLKANVEDGSNDDKDVAAARSGTVQSPAAAPVAASTSPSTTTTTTTFFQTQPAAAPAPPSNLFAPSTSKSPQASTSYFSFGRTTTTIPATDFSFGTTTAPALSSSAFSFAGTPASSAPAPASSSFSFSNTPAPEVLAAAATATTPAASETDDNAAETTEDDKVEEVTVGADDEEYDITFKCNVKIYDFREGDKANVHARGMLKLQRNKTTGKCLAVVRDTVTGNTKFTVGISEQTIIGPVRLTDPSKKKPNGAGDFSIRAQESEKYGVERFLFVVERKDGQPLHKAMEDLKKSAK
mmetsp:Transcript_19359/g.36141  ORF Transcript_19359/g.36141 Transcript_19359/m.36141 type:complete len:441 (+) Transcript_19359:109-1431(+)